MTKKLKYTTNLLAEIKKRKLPPLIRKKALAATKKIEKDAKYRKKIGFDKKIETLYLMFVWKNMDEGWTFWMGISNAPKVIKKTKKNKPHQKTTSGGSIYKEWLCTDLKHTGKLINIIMSVEAFLTNKQLDRIAVEALKMETSSEMREFESGATRDTTENKPDYAGYLSPLVIERFGQYMLKHQKQSNGELRASDNWQKGIPKEVYISSAFRHFIDVWKGHRGLPSPDGIEDSLCALLFNIQGYLHEYLKGIKDE